MNNFDIHNLGLRNLSSFIKTLYTLLVKEKIVFDLIIGSGNTGVFMVKLSELIYQKLGINFPSRVTLPILRYIGSELPENLFDNQVLYPDLVGQLKTVKNNNLTNILFVDDEIYAGHSVKSFMKLILQYKKEHNIQTKTVCTIVAEDQGVSPDFSIPEVETSLKLFAEGVDGMSNAITFCLSQDLSKPVEKALSNELNNHTHIIVNILMGLPIRMKSTEVIRPQFTDKYTKLAQERISNFNDLQNKTLKFLNEQIASTLEKLQL